MTDSETHLRMHFIGDLFMDKDYFNNFSLNKPVIDFFKSSDYNISNLESTILPILKKLSLNILTLANNHILDYGIMGLIDTHNVLEKNNIVHVGTGENLYQAKKPYSIKKNDINKAILNYAENEWSSASEISWGASPFDIIANSKQKKKIKKAVDFVFVVVHFGNEYYRYPSPRVNSWMLE